ncbi:MAG: ComEC/Rec2 family competence protein, partial [Coriobacteriia bacterium]|nr:ComEC/Rec2 family competence protein [Coriobacteriia bacterium]
MVTIPDESVIIEAVEDAIATRYGVVQTARITAGSGKGLRIQLYYGKGVRSLELGQRATLSSTIIPLANKESSRMNYTKEVVGRTSVSSLSRYHYSGPFSWVYRYREKLGALSKQINEHEGITRSVLLGDRRGISDQLKDEFARTGLSHLLAVSGAHFAVMAAGVLKSLSALSLSRRASQIITIVVCLLYVILTGCPASAVRSLGMLVLLSLNIVLRRRGSVLNSLCLTGLVCLVAKPFWAISLGFSLSVLAVGGIALFARYTTWMIQALIPRLSFRVTTNVALTFVALIMTTPLTSVQFGFISLVAPLSNVLVAPLMMTTLTIALCGAAIAWTSELSASILFACCAQINRVSELLIGLLAQISW